MLTTPCSLFVHVISPPSLPHLASCAAARSLLRLYVCPTATATATAHHPWRSAPLARWHHRLPDRPSLGRCAAHHIGTLLPSLHLDVFAPCSVPVPTSASIASVEQGLRYAGDDRVSLGPVSSRKVILLARVRLRVPLRCTGFGFVFVKSSSRFALARRIRARSGRRPPPSEPAVPPPHLAYSFFRCHVVLSLMRPGPSSPVPSSFSVIEPPHRLRLVKRA